MKTTTLKILLSTLLITFLFFMSACSEDDNNTVGYSVGIVSYSSSSGSGSLSGDLRTINNYLQSKGCSSDTWLIQGQKISSMDAEAISRFKSLSSKIKISEVEELGLDPSTTFSFGVSRFSHPDDSESEVLILASWDYPAK